MAFLCIVFQPPCMQSISDSQMTALQLGYWCSHDVCITSINWLFLIAFHDYAVSCYCKTWYDILVILLQYSKHYPMYCICTAYFWQSWYIYSCSYFLQLFTNNCLLPFSFCVWKICVFTLSHTQKLVILINLYRYII